MKKSKNETMNLVQAGKGKGKAYVSNKHGTHKISRTTSKLNSAYSSSKKHASNSMIRIKNDLASSSTGFKVNKNNFK